MKRILFDSSELDIYLGLKEISYEFIKYVLLSRKDEKKLGGR